METSPFRREGWVVPHRILTPRTPSPPGEGCGLHHSETPGYPAPAFPYKGVHEVSVPLLPATPHPRGGNTVLSTHYNYRITLVILVLRRAVAPCPPSGGGEG